MLGAAIFALAFQIGPFYQQKSDYVAVRPLTAVENGETDVLWPVFTCHRDWWRFCYLANWQDNAADARAHAEDYQFTILPVWFNGRAAGESYWGFFPLWGRHPHVLGMYDFEFALWPLWTRYEMPRGRERLVSKTVLFPFFSWRSDGAWSIWPLYGLNRQRESDHRYVLWPLATWAKYREDRDTAGEGFSWMFWPLYGQVRRARETQDMFLPPFFSYARATSNLRRRAASGELRTETVESTRIRAPWPLFEYESTPSRRRISFWPFYERSIDISYGKSAAETKVTRFGWKLVELYDDETRVFPFWASGRGHARVWPFWEREERKDGVAESRVLALFPIRWVPAVDRNWAKFWTLYESRACPLYTDHSLLWGIIRWRTSKE